MDTLGTHWSHSADYDLGHFKLLRLLKNQGKHQNT